MQKHAKHTHTLSKQAMLENRPVVFSKRKKPLWLAEGRSADGRQVVSQLYIPLEVF